MREWILSQRTSDCLQFCIVELFPPNEWFLWVIFGCFWVDWVQWRFYSEHFFKAHLIQKLVQLKHESWFSFKKCQKTSYNLNEFISFKNPLDTVENRFPMRYHKQRMPYQRWQHCKRCVLLFTQFDISLTIPTHYIGTCATNTWLSNVTLRNPSSSATKTVSRAIITGIEYIIHPFAVVTKRIIHLHCKCFVGEKFSLCLVLLKIARNF